MFFNSDARKRLSGRSWITQYFRHQFPQFGFDFFQGGPASIGDLIIFASFAFYHDTFGAEITRFLQAVQNRVKRARTEAIAVMLEFIQHRHAIKGFLGGMMQQMDADEGQEDVVIQFTHSFVFNFCYRSVCLAI